MSDDTKPGVLAWAAFRPDGKQPVLATIRACEGAALYLGTCIDPNENWTVRPVHVVEVNEP